MLYFENDLFNGAIPIVTNFKTHSKWVLKSEMSEAIRPNVRFRALISLSRELT